MLGYILVTGCCWDGLEAVLAMCLNYISQGIEMENNNGKATSYKDLLKSFQQAENGAQTPRTRKLVYRPQHLKNSTGPSCSNAQPSNSSLRKSNKQNFQASRSHTQTVHEKSLTTRSEWVQDDVLREYNQKRKDKQLQLTYNKFITNITSILAALTNVVPPQLLSYKITYLQYLAAMKQMAMIKDSYEPFPEDSVTGLWSELTCNGHTCGVFIVFVSSILHIRRSDDENVAKYAHLARKYAELRYTRMELSGKTRTLAEEDEFPFTPVISQKSRTLAGSRSKSRSRKDRCLVQQSFNNYSEEQEEPETQTTSVSHLDSKAGSRRSQILYRLAKEKSLEKRRDKKSTDVEYQKSIKELTFQPSIHPNSTKVRRVKEIQGEQDSINRMIRGRVEKEVRKIINQKGLPYNEKMFEKMKKERYEALQKHKKNQCVFGHHAQPGRCSEDEQKERERDEQKEREKDKQKEREEEEEGLQPIGREEGKGKSQPIVLTIEVDENRCQKLVIQQPTRYKEAAAKFIKDLNLGSEMYDKLIEGVEKALKFQLTQVDEDSCESEYDSV